MPEDTRSKLATVLGELHELLESADDLDAGARDALRDAAGEINDALDSDDGIGAPLDALRERIERFEGDHPTLTEAVRRLVDQLAEMGI